jgi:branched-chain amino acid transport system ATP-binding protein
MLRVEKLESGYGPSKVLFGVDLEIAPRQVVSLIGRNGMGKTTTVKTLMGMLPTQGGSVMLDGKSIASLAPHRIARLGLGLVPEGRRVFPSLSVEENLLATARGATAGNSASWHLGRVYELFPRLQERRQQSARTLSGGEQQMLAVGRALLTNPRLLILDEATEGLAPLIRQEIWHCLRRLKEDGQTILVIDKNLKEMATLVDRHHVLEKGRVVWEGTPQEFGQNPELANRYLGV